ncbi:MAG: response regulator [Anaerolineae bacterium]|nr:response regulator [Anaerolineae bacterium]
MAGETILIVDDAQQNHHFLNDYVLLPNGFKPLSARDGVEGLQMAIRHKPDLILLDLNMPRMDGMQVLRELGGHNLDMPVILMTFHGSEDIAVEVYRLGVRDYVIKPFYPDEMLKAIEKSLAETRLKREKDTLIERLTQANRELQSRVNELNVLYGIGKSVVALQPIDQLVTRLVDAAVQMTGAEEAYLMLADGDKQALRAVKRADMPRAQLVQASVVDPIAAQVIKSGRPIVLDAEKLKRIPGSPHSAAYAPLVIQDRAFGALGVRNIKADSITFTQNHGALLSALSDYGAIAMENARNLERRSNPS